MDKRWKSSHNVKYNLGYHLIWCPKYRRDVLKDDVADRLEKLLKEKAKEIEIEIIELSIMPDHIHLFINAKPVDSPHFIVQQLKGYTSRILRQEFPQLRSRIPTLWTRSYYVESVGHISADTIQKYIQEQKGV